MSLGILLYLSSGLFLGWSLGANDAANVAELGYRLALVGTALMRSDDPASLVAAMREAGSAGIAA